MHLELRNAYREEVFNAGFTDSKANVLPIFYPDEGIDTTGSKTPADIHLRVDLLPVDERNHLLQIAIYTLKGFGDMEATRLKGEIEAFFKFGKVLTNNNIDFVIGNTNANAPFYSGGFRIQPMTINIEYIWKC